MHLNLGCYVGCYVKECIEYTVRDNLATSKIEFEVLWIQIENDSQHNMFRGIMY